MPVGKKSLERAEGTAKTGGTQRKRTAAKKSTAAKPSVEEVRAKEQPVTEDVLVPAQKTWEVISHIACDLPDYLL